MRLQEVFSVATSGCVFLYPFSLILMCHTRAWPNTFVRESLSLMVENLDIMRIAVSASQVLIRTKVSLHAANELTHSINMAVPVNKTAHPFNKQQLESVLT